MIDDRPNWHRIICLAKYMHGGGMAVIHIHAMLNVCVTIGVLLQQALKLIRVLLIVDKNMWVGASAQCCPNWPIRC